MVVAAAGEDDTKTKQTDPSGALSLLDDGQISGASLLRDSQIAGPIAIDNSGGGSDAYTDGGAAVSLTQGVRSADCTETPSSRVERKSLIKHSLQYLGVMHVFRASMGSSKGLSE
jgi:hypothetical protein